MRRKRKEKNEEKREKNSAAKHKRLTGTVSMSVAETAAMAKTEPGSGIRHCTSKMLLRNSQSGSPLNRQCVGCQNCN